MVNNNQDSFQQAKAFRWAGNSRTYVDKLVQITLSQVMEDRGIVKVCQVGHIFAFFVFGWIDLADEVFLEILGLLVKRFVRQATTIHA